MSSWELKNSSSTNAHSICVLHVFHSKQKGAAPQASEEQVSMATLNVKQRFSKVASCAHYSARYEHPSHVRWFSGPTCTCPLQSIRSRCIHKQANQITDALKMKAQHLTLVSYPQFEWWTIHTPCVHRDCAMESLDRWKSLSVYRNGWHEVSQGVALTPWWWAAEWVITPSSAIIGLTPQ